MRKIKLVTKSIDSAVKFIRKSDRKWIDSNQVAKASKCALRTARWYLHTFKAAGILEVKPSYPRKLYRLKSKKKLAQFVKQTTRVAM